MDKNNDSMYTESQSDISSFGLWNGKSNHRKIVYDIFLKRYLGHFRSFNETMTFEFFTELDRRGKALKVCSEVYLP